ncbi:mitochondrial import inner membrane translocase subunit Tim29-like [Parambassis ranga]|uniref:Mitochondrial import inner membrane translocase subunit Tim29-like n=1 Tax=Parambassis ranga TaxID=210632 RepID=A0A6P7HLE8_9TELE|nr:mitochondrial import inner membrane translocase subunit Tim29-like [Parambassis ranga]
MASWRVARRMFCAAAEAPAAPGPSSRWERLKSSKAGVWCRSLVSDYKEACREMVVGAWEKPLKASVYGTLLGGVLACFYSKPDRMSFEADLLERSNQLCLLSPWIRSGTSDGHIQTLVKLRNEGRLQHASLGVLSVMYRTDYDPDTMLYEAQCSNLSVPWRELPQRILDIGFVGHWWVLDSRMKDYDVNDEEFKHLPAYMQVTSPPSIQEVERNERLHNESLLPLTVEDEEKETKVVNKEESQSQPVVEKQAQA